MTVTVVVDLVDQECVGVFARHADAIRWVIGWMRHQGSQGSDAAVLEKSRDGLEVSTHYVRGA